MLRSLQAAIEDRPDDVALRLHAAELLLEHGTRRVRRRSARPCWSVTRLTRRPQAGPAGTGFDWGAAEAQVADVIGPAFADSTAGDAGDDVERSSVRLADVGGMDEVKRRLDMAFLTPMRNPQLRRLFGRSLPGGLLLYGPPGCGKTFLARAVAGELGAQFYSVSLADVLDMWLGPRGRRDECRLAGASAAVG